MRFQQCKRGHAVYAGKSFAVSKCVHVRFPTSRAAGSILLEEERFLFACTVPPIAVFAPTLPDVRGSLST